VKGYISKEAKEAKERGDFKTLLTSLQPSFGFGHALDAIHSSIPAR
jgi:hypothetical protein